MLFPYQKDKWKWQGRQYPQSPSLMPPTIGHVAKGDEWKFQWQHPDAHITSESGPLQQSPALPGMVPRTSQTPFYEYEAAHSTSPVVAPRTPMAGKKGLSMKNMINAMSKLKSPTGMDFGRSGGRAGGRRPSGGDPLTGLSATYPYTGVTKPSNEAIERLRKWGY